MIVLPSRSPFTVADGWPLNSSLSEPCPSVHGKDTGSIAKEQDNAQPCRVSKSAESQHKLDDLPDLPNDILIEVLSRLDGCNRLAVHGCCKRLRDLADSTFNQIAIPVPAATSGAAGRKSAAAMKARMASMATIVLQLPPLEQVTKPAAATDKTPVPTDALDLFLDASLASCFANLRAEVLRIRAADSPATTCQISFAALTKLASAAPHLQCLSLPLLSSQAAAALPLFTTNVTILNLTVTDGATLDHALQLTQLRKLSISTRKGLLYLMLSQRQVADLARMAHLQKLTLNNVLINDCHVTWQPLAALTSLTELEVSSPFSAERLQQLPASLRVLQVPFFSSGMETLVSLPPTFALKELRCRQAFTEQDLAALSYMRSLATLQCDNIIVSEAMVAAVQAAGGMPPPAPEPADGGRGVGGGGVVTVPVLKTVTHLRVTGYHAYNGLLGLMFPSLENLQMVSVTVPRPAPAYTAPMPMMKRLAWPSSKVLPAVLAACPHVSCLVVPGINCLQRLEELLHMPPPDQAVAAAAAAGRKGGSQGPCWWPARLSDLTLGFSSSLRFRPKQVACALAAVPEVVQDHVEVLSLRDHSHDASEPGRVVDDAVLAAVVKSMRQIKELRISDCGALTGVGLLHGLEAAAPKLATVVVAGCPKVTRSKAERIPCVLGRPLLNVQWRQLSDA